MDTKKIAIGVFVATTLVFGVLAFKAPVVIQTEKLGSQAPVVVPAPVVQVEAAQPVVVPAPVVNVNVPRQETRLGSVSSPDIQSPYFSVGGLPIWAQRTNSLTQASTTVCSIQSPAATSSLLFAGIEFDVASTSATYVELARATTPYATTTRIGSTYTIAANAQANIVASTTGSVAGDATIFPPNSYFNVKVSWATAATSASVPRGSCGVMWAAM
jgi:hypothetical protein